MGNQHIDSPNLCPSLMYAPAEYCAPVWSRSKHNRLVDISLNSPLHTITGCLQPTSVEEFRVLTGIPPSKLRRQAVTMTQAHHAMNPGISKEQNQPRLKSWYPFAPSGRDLAIHSTHRDKVHWIANKWSQEWQTTSSQLINIHNSTSHKLSRV